MMRSRLTALAVAASLAIAGPANAQMQVLVDVREFGAIELGGEKFPSAAAGIGDAAHRIMVVGADDLAVAASIVSIVAGLNSLFGHKPDDAAIKEKLEELSRQNTFIIGQLEKVIDILSRLDVTIARVVREEFLKDLRSDIASATQQFAETRLALLADPNYRKQALIEHEKQFTKIRDLTRKMRAYGYGVFDTIGVNMYFEDDLSQILSRNKAERKQALLFYKDYFTKLLDPKEAESLGSSLAYTKDVLAKTDAILTAADAALASNRVFRVEQGREFAESDFECTTRWRADLFNRIDGDRKSGYSLAQYWGDRYDVRTRCHHCNPKICLSVDERMARAERKLTIPAHVLAIEVPSPPTSNSPGARVTFLNQAKAVHSEATSRLAVLEKLIEGAEAFLKEANRRLVGL